MLVVHGELDCRLTVADGLAAFNVLQSRGVESEMLVFKDEVNVAAPARAKRGDEDKCRHTIS